MKRLSSAMALPAVVGLIGAHALGCHQPSAEPVLEAIRRGDLPAVRDLVSKGADPNAAVTELRGWQAGEPHWWRETPLGEAVAAGQDDILRYLLGAGADPNGRVTGGTRLGDSTPLLIACICEKETAVAILLDHGADPRIRTESGSTALELAAERDRPTSVYRLLATLVDGPAEAEAVEEIEGALEALEWSNAASRFEIEKLLEDAKIDRLGGTSLTSRLEAWKGREAELLASDVSIGEDTGWTALILASGAAGNAALVRRLLDLGFDPSAATREGWTPLMAAVRSNDLERVDLLIQAGADPKAQMTDGHSALWIAVIGASRDVIISLLEAGAVVPPPESWPRNLARIDQLASYRDERDGSDIAELLGKRSATRAETDSAD